MKACVCALAAVLLAAPADATWYRASSEHFLIYAQQRPDQLRSFAESLERFDGAVRALRGMDDLPLSQGNRVTIFELPSAEVQRLAGDKSGFIQGFYEGRASGSLAYVGAGEESNASTHTQIGSHISTDMPNTNLTGLTILLHEYSHHLMMQDLAVPYPEWLVEGFAEFMSTAQFERDGSVGIGLPALHRYYGLLNTKPLPLETLLSGKHDKLTAEQEESIYGRGWLLTHYLTFEPSRKGQLHGYLIALAKGTEPLQAARDNFGDLSKLERDLDAYLHRQRLDYLKVSGAALKFTPIQISALTAGGNAVLPLLAEVEKGTTESQTDAMVQKVRAVEHSYAGDELVETTLAEAELDANHPDAAQVAAERAMAANAHDTDAIVLKGRAILERAKHADGESRAKMFNEARETFVAANKIDSEDPEPLMEYYRAYVTQGLKPTANAIAALHYASVLAPQDLGLRMNSTMAFLEESKTAEARRELIPVAYDPHGGDLARIARSMMDRIDAGDIKGALAVAEAAAKSQGQ